MLVISSLAITLLAPARIYQQATVQITGKSLELALPEIGNVFQTKLSASPSTARDVIVMAVKDASLKDVMAHISTAFEATWRETSTGYMLVRTADQVRDQRKRELATRAKTISLGLEAKRKELEKFPVWDEKEADKMIKEYQSLVRTFNPNDQRSSFWQKANELQKRSPLARALSQLISYFDANELAQIGSDSAMVWSSQPTRMQRPLPQRVVQAIGNAVAIEKQWRQKISAAGLSAPQVGNTTYYLPGISDSNDSLDEAQKVNIRVRNSQMTGGMQVQVTILSSEKAELQSTYDYLNRGFAPDLFESKKPKEGEILLELQGFEKACAEAFQPMQQQIKKIEPQFLDLLLNPVQNDPLGLLGGPLLIQYAAKTKQNLVAHVSDMAVLTFLGQTKIPLSQFETRFSALLHSISSKDGWLEVQPTMAIEDRENRVDRKALARYVQKTIGPSFPLEERSTILAQLPLPNSNVLPAVWEMLALGKMSPQVDASRIVRFYGMLAPNQRLAMKNAQLQARNLQPNQLAELEKVVYGGDGRISITREAPKAMKPGRAFNPTSDPTEVLPNGIPADALLKVNITEETVAIPIRTGGQPGYYENPAGTNASTLAWNVVEQERGINNNTFRGTLSTEKINVSQRLNYQFIIELGPGISMNTTSYDLVGQIRTVSYSELPEAFKTEYERNLKSYRAMRIDDSGTVRGVIPPQP